MTGTEVKQWNLHGTLIQYFICESPHGAYFILGAIRRFLLKTNVAVDHIDISLVISEDGRTHYWHAFVLHSMRMSMPYLEAAK